MKNISREKDRAYDERRKAEIITGYLDSNPYSVLITTGKTKVICTATTGNWMPPHIKNQNKGWVTAEYSMLPSSSPFRIRRERAGAKGRTREIERMIARSLRSVCELEMMPMESVIVDCDVIQADGGTRTASITGGFVALYLLLDDLYKRRKLPRFPINNFLAATSVGVIHGQAALDLDCAEDQIAQVDMNVVMTENGMFSEIQASGEEATFSPAHLTDMVKLGTKGVKELIQLQREALSPK
ncbi:MAG: ribonuclease PH [Elusimicrobia bacterium]|nr:ribonuclease PH [Elusimicrobiota bacterium]